MKTLVTSSLWALSVATAFVPQHDPPIHGQKMAGNEFEETNDVRTSPATSNDDENETRSTSSSPPLRKNEIIMSPAIPFLECPAVLVDCTVRDH